MTADCKPVREISEMDKQHYLLAREHIKEFREKWMFAFDQSMLIAEIGPEQDVCSTAETIGLAPGCDFRYDITCSDYSAAAPEAGRYKGIICTEVIEHCVEPHKAIREICRIAEHGALCLFSAPWNFRLHHPTPDLWRISVHGWKVLLRNFDIVQIDVLETPGRWLMPIHYCIAATVNKLKDVRAQDVQFEDVK